MNTKVQNTNLLPYLLIAVLVMVIIYQQMIIYAYFGGRDLYSIISYGNNISLKPERVSGLSEQIIGNTPEYTHFNRDANFKWVFLVADSFSIQTELYNAVFQRLKSKYEIYRSSENIPCEYIQKNEKGRIIHYHGGFRFSYCLEYLSRNKVRIHYEDWEGNLAASGFWIIYKWSNNKWEIIKKGPMWVS